MLVDVHTHLDDSQFTDLPEVIERAKKAGLGLIITQGTSLESNKKVLEICKKYSIVKPALGLAPVTFLQTSKEADACFEFIEKNKPVAIGEVGLDNHWIKDRIPEQKVIFEKFIQLAEKHKIPLSVHSRDAELETIEILESSKAKVIMHCFGGNMKLVKRMADNGWSLSIPTSVVYDNHFQKIVELVDLNQLFTETDAPYLSPWRGKRNEPAFVAESIKKIAEIKKITTKEAEEQIEKNANHMFSI